MCARGKPEHDNPHALSDLSVSCKTIAGYRPCELEPTETAQQCLLALNVKRIPHQLDIHVYEVSGVIGECTILRPPCRTMTTAVASAI